MIEAKMPNFLKINHIFIVDMTIEEADKMMEDIDRSLTFNEEGL